MVKMALNLKSTEITCPCSIGYNFVPPEGSEAPDIYFVGEAPGEEEAKQGRPFVGRAGKVLRKLIEDIGIKEYRIFNAVACRPTKDGGNRTPGKEEIQNCSGWVKVDIEKYKPRIIVLLGKSAVTAFYSDWEQPLRDVIYRDGYIYKGIPICFAYHPSYILRRGGIEARAYREEFLEPIRTFIHSNV